MPSEPVKPPKVGVRRDVTITLPRTFVLEAVAAWAVENGHLPRDAPNQHVTFQCIDEGGGNYDLHAAVITYREETPDAG